MHKALEMAMHSSNIDNKDGINVPEADDAEKDIGSIIIPS